MATDTALPVIDMQVGNVGAAYQREEIVARLAGIVAEARRRDAHRLHPARG